MHKICQNYNLLRITHAMMVTSINIDLFFHLQRLQGVYNTGTLIYMCRLLPLKCEL